jgi:hypothetical protein
MKLKIAFGCALFGIAAALTPAQGPATFTMSCSPLEVFQNITSSTKVGTFTCTSTANINGVAFKTLVFSAYSNMTPTEFKVWGVIVGTLANGSQVNFTYQNVHSVRNGVVVGSGSMDYKIASGSGTAKGISGSGTCKGQTNSSGGSDLACVGDYKLP